MSRPTCSVTRSTSSCASTLRREMQPGRRRGRRAALARVDRLVALGVAERLRDVRRQRHRSRRLAVEAHPPAPLAQMLEQLDRSVPLARRAACASGAPAPPRCRRRPARGAAPRRADARSGSAPGRPACRSRPRAPSTRSGQLAEDVVLHLAGRAPVDEQPRLVAPRGRMLRDQLRRQVVVELVGLHPVRTVASPIMEEIREALRDGLREEAAPISRRLAEVKGLSNNAIRRLESIERRSTPSETRASTTWRCSSSCSPRAGGR